MQLHIKINRTEKPFHFSSAIQYILFCSISVGSTSFFEKIKQDFIFFTALFANLRHLSFSFYFMLNFITTDYYFF